MKTFLEILTHQRKLQAATAELSLEQLEEAQAKLGNIIAKKIEKLEEEESAKTEKKAKVESILSLLNEEGLTLDDVNEIAGPATQKKQKQKRPIKYILVDEEGKEHTWTGIGRMPKIYKMALDSGKSLEDYSIS